jgi:hypothetical protein
MSSLSFKMSQQMVLARTLGIALAELENRVTEAEENNRTVSLLYNKTQYFDLFGACDSIAQAMYTVGGIAASQFMDDLNHAQQTRIAELRGDFVNV